VTIFSVISDSAVIGGVYSIFVFWPVFSPFTGMLRALSWNIDCMILDDVSTFHTRQQKSPLGKIETKK
jgi:hypothetical protein